MKKAVLLIIGLAVCACLWAWAQTPIAPKPLAEWMPAGALLILDSPDFATELRTWNRSEVKSRWLASKNYQEFSTTRLVLKLKQAYTEFSNAAGFEPGLNELETVAGTDSALALYDIGRLDLVYISRLPAAQLGQNVLTRVRSGYQTRNTQGQSYFVRQAGDRTAAFATVGDFVVVSTREDLLSAALALIQGNTGRSLGQEAWHEGAIRAMPGSAAPYAFRLVANLPRLIRTPHFRSYWIQRNTDDLRGYSALLAQVSRKADAFEEERVLIRSEEAQVTAHEAAAAELQRYIPDDVGLFRLWDSVSPDAAMNLIREKLFAAGARTPARRQFAPVVNLEGAAGSGDFQTRIDEAPKPSLEGALDLEPLRSLVQSAGVEALLHLESNAVVNGQTFVNTDAAVALRSASNWNAGAIRGALTSAVSSYQSVNNIGLQWRNVSSGAATLSQWDGLFPLTVYVDGQTLWIAKTPALIGAALAHSSSSGPPQPGNYLARYNHRLELPPYLKLMHMLDLSDQANYSSFFSENMGSLASTLNGFESVSVKVSDSGTIRREAVRYAVTR